MVNINTLIFKSGSKQSNMLYCNNKTAINIVHNPIQHNATNYTKVSTHFINEYLHSGQVFSPYLPSSSLLANVFAKGISRTSFRYIVGSLGCKIS